jgi:hypothetical protein
MKKTFARIPWFYILLTFYPLLFLWTANISEIDPSVVIRPFLVTLLGSALLYGILYALLRNVGKAALVGCLILVAFFSYGHIYYLVRMIPALKILNHHITLMPIFLIVFGFGIWGISRIKDYRSVIRYFNVVSLALVLIQVVQLGYSYIGTFYEARRPVTLQSGLVVTTKRSDLPDIYLIVLDSYTREDAMQQDLGFDNSQFIDQLENMGFYVARCSRSNYRFTLGSIASMLNMQYYPQAYASDFAGSTFWTVINNSEVRRQLESVGYKTVSFLGDDPRVALTDANVLFEVNRPGIDFSSLHAFEAMYIQSTATIILRDIDTRLKISQYFSLNTTNQNTPLVDFSGMGPDNQDLIREHVTAQLFFLDKLPEVPSIADPKFTYAHISIPHPPYVFSPDGKMLTDPGFYSGANGDAVNREYQEQGYLSQVQYINQRIIPILQTIIEKSKTPPIIILMGDHGLRDDNRYTNLNAYYLPNGSKGLYKTITPVNSFRVILNEYFGANYPLLPDLSYSGDGSNHVENETYTDCIP